MSARSAPACAASNSPKSPPSIHTRLWRTGVAPGDELAVDAHPVRSVGDQLRHPALVGVAGVTDVRGEDERQQPARLEVREQSVEAAPVGFVRRREVGRVGRRVGVGQAALPRPAVEPPQERRGAAIVERHVAAARVVADHGQFHGVEAAPERVLQEHVGVGRRQHRHEPRGAAEDRERPARRVDEDPSVRRRPDRKRPLRVHRPGRIGQGGKRDGKASKLERASMHHEGAHSTARPVPCAGQAMACSGALDSGGR